MSRHLCRARYLPKSYPEVDTRCGQPFAHLGDHKTRVQIPVTHEGETTLEFAEWGDVIHLVKPEDGSEGLMSKCTCMWSAGPSTLTIKIGKEAFKHSQDTGHYLRKHDEL